MRYIDIDSSALKTLYLEQQLSCRQIAFHFGVSQAKILRELHHLGCHIRQQTNRSDLDTKRIVDLYCNQKMSSRQVAAKLNYKPAIVRNILKDSGVLRNHKQATKVGLHEGRIKPLLPEMTKRYKGGVIEARGYIKIRQPSHPKAVNGYVRRSRLVWEEVHNRPLPEDCVIHHINGIKSDDNPHNLLAMPKGQHHGFLVQQATQERIRELEVQNRHLVGLLEMEHGGAFISDN